MLTKPFHHCSLCLPNVMYIALFTCNTVDYILSLTIFLIKQTTFTEKTMKIILDLNSYVKQTCEKVLQPLLLQNDCKEIKINTSSWVFEKCLLQPDKEEWKELTNWKIEESQKRQTIPVHGKLKVQENNIYLQVYIKYWKLRELTQADINNANYLKEYFKQQDAGLSAKEEGSKEEQYYSCKLLLGPFSKDKLTNRSQKASLNVGIHIQDLKFEFPIIGQFKLYKTFKGNLTYMTEDQYKNSIKFLRGRNREIKLDGQYTKGTQEDPRNWLDDTEMKAQLRKRRYKYI